MISPIDDDEIQKLLVDTQVKINDQYDPILDRVRREREGEWEVLFIFFTFFQTLQS